MTAIRVNSPIKTATGSGTTTASGAFPLSLVGITNSNAIIVLSAKLTNRTGTVMHRGDAYLTCYDAYMANLANENVTVEVAYVDR